MRMRSTLYNSVRSVYIYQTIKVFKKQREWMDDLKRDASDSSITIQQLTFRKGIYYKLIKIFKN